MELDSNLILACVVTSGVGYLMMVAGLGKSMLELRRRPRTCPSCGRHLKARACSACRR